MSIIERAGVELGIINFGNEDTEVMIQILTLFFEQWDSGGAVSVVAPVLQRLIAGKPLSPLTGKPSEFMDGGDGVFQNRRCSTVFMDPRFHDGKLAYDLDNPRGEREPITFPYWPERFGISPPVIEVEVPDK